MLAIFEGKQPMSRRELFPVNTLGLGGLPLSSLLGAKALAKSGPREVAGLLDHPPIGGLGLG